MTKNQKIMFNQMKDKNKECFSKMISYNKIKKRLKDKKKMQAQIDLLSFDLYLIQKNS